MSSTPHSLTTLPRTPAAARLLCRVLERVQVGRLTVWFPNGHIQSFAGPLPGPQAVLHIHQWKALSVILSSADIGIAECWRDGLIDTPDMTAFLEFCVANEQRLSDVFYGNPVTALIYRLYHALRPNTKRGAKKNIHAHYDLGNAFYALWLDPSMTYSAAVFGDNNADDLQTAQTAKYQRIIDELGITRDHHVLEIGCGWGGFAEHAARTTGCRITGVTISAAQLEYSKARIAAAGLTDRVELRFQDYRDIEGTYDKIVSIEMVEAVGERYWPTYFRTLHERLSAGGEAMIQAITIDELVFESYRKTSDFIREYIFPGGMLASVSRLMDEAVSAQLRVHEPFRFGSGYAETLRRWRHAVEQNADRIRTLGFDDKFLKIWRFYLHYCEVGFNTARTDVIHLKLSRCS